ncbi:hypothetical protein A2524_01055 [Candidatus Wolfebacteria bacterium RIFOXYD12_FULL_48_21]|uniref:Uncharacterized protein n=1 Tax=Candidatus Wolfebacteria bacterium RIFOXYD1_FULL_48_65 TaxID=1802561 RepID=A0A1F8E063_9BACT|nr:MAG: hypothetical protein A2610_03000 [Candidatus Wolfebacteria bacterium RIFOXYD1_FULL_48_65]OGM94397.1 MAG: hypothetical protein A2524_01055 [Candidatus Wolfebacteria bacterium RIFOXYD12_FULL_48_21]OGM97426.1 MAG: hypothetical protein A2532_02085 [Candidatus Wolfebacteria bacterium RIFOXYD2_FULL_48_11]
MAIVLEKEQKSFDWNFILGIMAVVGIVGAAVVYLFFVSPETVQQLTTPEQKTLSEFSQVRFRPEEILNSAAFQSLRTLAPMTVPSGAEVGKLNPFLQ